MHVIHVVTGLLCAPISFYPWEEMYPRPTALITAWINLG
jgi:hypothetical protein